MAFVTRMLILFEGKGREGKDSSIHGFSASPIASIRYLLLSSLQVYHANQVKNITN